MPNTYAKVAAASRLADLPERIRDRELENQDRELRLSDRNRRIAREDEQLGRERQRFSREETEWKHEDTLRDLDMGDRLQRDAEHIEDRARQRRINLRSDTEHEQDRDYTKRERDFRLSESKKQAGRSAVVWADSREALETKMREEGMHDMLTALERGADPRMVEQEFNKSGELGIQPGTLAYDPATKQLKFVDSDGEEFDGSIDQLKAIFVEPKAPIKLGKNDRLVDPATKKDIVPPAGGAGDDDVTKWNRQTASDHAADVVREGLGLKYDSELKVWAIPEGMSEKVSFGASLAGEVTRHFGSRVSAEEAGDIALQIAKSVPTLREAQIMAQQQGKTSEKDIADTAAKIIRSARVTAAQQLAMLIQDKETELEQKEAAAEASPGGAAPGAPQKPRGERPPLGSFERPN